MAWRETPPGMLIKGLRLVGDSWEQCSFDEMRPGDIVRMISPDGDAIHPHTEEPDADCVSLVDGYPIKNDLGQAGKNPGFGYAVSITVFPSIHELNKRGLS